MKSLKDLSVVIHEATGTIGILDWMSSKPTLNLDDGESLVFTIKRKALTVGPKRRKYSGTWLYVGTF